MKVVAPENPRISLWSQSPMAITGAILAIGVIRLQDKKSLNESAIQAVDTNLDFRERTPSATARGEGAGVV